jgi:hemoglobin-like flavoprotein
MNHRQLELVRSSYERIRMVRPLFADLFHRRLLLIAPGLEPLFAGDPARRDAAFLDFVDSVVLCLDRLDLLLPALAGRARRWNRRGVTDADYELAGKALAWTVAQLLAASAATIAAWGETFELLASVMKRAASDAQAVPPAPPPRRALTTLPYPDRLPPNRRSSLPPPSVL